MGESPAYHDELAPYLPEIHRRLSSVPYVRWDRFVYDRGVPGRDWPEVRVYGWIHRPKDGMKDFVIVDITLLPEGKISPLVLTSSGEKSRDVVQKIQQLTDEDMAGHLDCLRLEDYLGHVEGFNCVRLEP